MKDKKKKKKTQETIQPEAILSIDLNELDKEWARQPKLYFDYASELAHSRRKLDETEAEVKLVKAEIDRDIRDKPILYNLKQQPTEASINTTIFLQPRFKEVQRRVIILQERVNVLEAMVKSLDHKKAALENMVRLDARNYFAEPRTDADGMKVLDEQRSDRVSKMCKKDTRR